jgi:hypothetical protein
MRIGGVRVSVQYVRLLAQIVEDAGFDDTAQALADAIRLQAMHAPLTIDDHEAILTALDGNCPSGLAKLRRALLEEQVMRRRREGLS